MSPFVLYITVSDIGDRRTSAHAITGNEKHQLQVFLNQAYLSKIIKTQLVDIKIVRIHILIN